MFVSWATGLSGEVVDRVFLYILVVTVFLLCLITFLMIYFVIKYQKRRNPQPADVHENIWLEIVWTVGAHPPCSDNVFLWIDWLQLPEACSGRSDEGEGDRPAVVLVIRI